MAAMIVATALLARTSPAHACAPARLGPEAASLPLPWRQALDALVAATTDEGQPWSCPDARVSLTLHGDVAFAELVVEDVRGGVPRLRRRRVASPADVVPLGEAMLAKVSVPEPTEPSAPPVPPVEVGGPALSPPRSPANDNAGPGPTAPMGSPIPPRQGAELYLGLLAGPRFSAPLQTVWMAASIRAVVALESWSAGLWGRYNGPVAILHLDPKPPQFSMSEMTFGLTGGYKLIKSPVELTASLEPIVAVVIMSSLRPGNDEEDSDAKVDFRLGGRLGLAVPMTSRLRLLVAFDGEAAPGALGSEHSRWVDRRLQLPMPAYTVGLSVGMEVAAIR
jgi:hypothetical protein